MHEVTGILMKDEEYIERLNRDGLISDGITHPTLAATLSEEVSPTPGGRSVACAPLENS